MYYEPHASRDNLTVLTSAHVARISLSKLFDREARAEAVNFLHEGDEYRVFVEREVIVSAGYANCLPPGSRKPVICICLFQGNSVPAG